MFAMSSTIKLICHFNNHILLPKPCFSHSNYCQIELNVLIIKILWVLGRFLRRRRVAIPFANVHGRRAEHGCAARGQRGGAS